MWNSESRIVNNGIDRDLYIYMYSFNIYNKTNTTLESKIYKKWISWYARWNKWWCLEICGINVCWIEVHVPNTRGLSKHLPDLCFFIKGWVPVTDDRRTMCISTIKIELGVQGCVVSPFVSYRGRLLEAFTMMVPEHVQTDHSWQFLRVDLFTDSLFQFSLRFEFKNTV